MSFIGAGLGLLLLTIAGYHLLRPVPNQQGAHGQTTLHDLLIPPTAAPSSPNVEPDVAATTLQVTEHGHSLGQDVGPGHGQENENKLGQEHEPQRHEHVPQPHQLEPQRHEPGPDHEGHGPEIVHSTPTEPPAPEQLPTNMRIIKEILQEILPLDDVHLEVVKEILPVTIEIAKLVLHFL